MQVMGQTHAIGRNNHDLVDLQAGDDIIETARVEFAFRMIDRGLFFKDCTDNIVYSDVAWKETDGRLHISAPSIYSMVLEHLQPQRGHKFLNLGSGSGYFSTVVGMFLGSGSVNHGVELFSSNIDWALSRQEEIKKNLIPAIFDWCAPQFFKGNVFQLKTDMQYDRIYVGAKVPEGMRLQFVKLLKVGGVAIMPYGNILQRIQRSSEKTFLSFNINNVDFSNLCLPEPGSEYDCPVEIPMESAVPTLSSFAKRVILEKLRDYAAAMKVVTVRQRCLRENVARYPFDDAEDNMLNDPTNVTGEVQDENIERIVTPERSADGYTIFELQRYTMRVRMAGRLPDHFVRLHTDFTHFGEITALFGRRAMAESSEDEEEEEDGEEREEEPEDEGIIYDNGLDVLRLRGDEQLRNEFLGQVFVDTVNRMVNHHRDEHREETPPIEDNTRPRRQVLQLSARPPNYVPEFGIPHNTVTSTSSRAPEEYDDVDITNSSESSNDTIISNAATTSSTSGASSTNSSSTSTPTNPPTFSTGTNATNRKRRARSSSPSCAKYSRRPADTYAEAPEPFRRPGLRMITSVNADSNCLRDHFALVCDMQVYYNHMKRALDTMPLPRKVAKSLLSEEAKTVDYSMVPQEIV